MVVALYMQRITGHCLRTPVQIPARLLHTAVPCGARSQPGNRGEPSTIPSQLEGLRSGEKRCAKPFRLHCVGGRNGAGRFL